MQLSELAQMMARSYEVADAYEALFGALRLAPSLASGNSILVTSAEPGEGKTSISSCLAITAARAGQSALLIDGDLRRSSLTASVAGPGTAGLVEVLLGQVDAAAAIRHVAIGQVAIGQVATPQFVGFAGSSPVGSVSFIGGGRKSAVSLAALDWPRARTAFRSIAQAFGIVFLDSPPILAANDALLLANLVDAVLLVVGAGSAKVDEVRRAKEQLEATGTPIIGVVLNRFEPTVHGRSTQPYRGYYQVPRADAAHSVGQ